jgi:hypothetical protein
LWRSWSAPSNTRRGDDFPTLASPFEVGIGHETAGGRGTSDPVNLRYPTLYDTAADAATLEFEIAKNGDSQPTWRLYRVNKPVPLG